MVARTATSRQRIVEKQRVPPTCITAWYSKATGPIQEFLLGGGRELRPLLNAIQVLKQARPAEGWDRIRHSICIEAMEKLSDLADKLDFGDKRAISKRRRAVLVLSGVDVSVRPDIILLKRRRDGAMDLGAIKLCLAKTEPLPEEAGLYIATVVRRYLEVTYADHRVAHQLCQVANPHTGEVWTAPESCKTRFKDLEAACREILLLWESGQAAA